MKRMLLVAISLALAAGCGSKAGSPSACNDAVGKGVDTMIAASKKRMEGMNVPDEMKSKLDDASAKLKDVIAKHCVDDKWSKEVIDCYASATKREDLRDCRGKLPTDQAAKLQADEMQVMSSMMGGMGGMMGHGMHGMHGGSGMAGGGMPPANDSGGGMVAPPPPAPGSAAAPAGSAAPAAGSGK